MSPQLTECRTSPTLGISDYLIGLYGPQLQGLLHQPGDTIRLLLIPVLDLYYAVIMACVETLEEVPPLCVRSLHNTMISVETCEC